MPRWMYYVLPTSLYVWMARRSSSSTFNWHGIELRAPEVGLLVVTKPHIPRCSNPDCYTEINDPSTCTKLSCRRAQGWEKK